MNYVVEGLLILISKFDYINTIILNHMNCELILKTVHVHHSGILRNTDLKY